MKNRNLIVFKAIAVAVAGLFWPGTLRADDNGMLTSTTSGAQILSGSSGQSIIITSTPNGAGYGSEGCTFTVSGALAVQNLTLDPPPWIASISPLNSNFNGILRGTVTAYNVWFDPINSEGLTDTNRPYSGSSQFTFPVVFYPEISPNLSMFQTELQNTLNNPTTHGIRLRTHGGGLRGVRG